MADLLIGAAGSARKRGQILWQILAQIDNANFNCCSNLTVNSQLSATREVKIRRAVPPFETLNQHKNQIFQQEDDIIARVSYLSFA